MQRSLFPPLYIALRKSRRYGLLGLLLSLPWLTFAQCPTGDVTLSTQAQVNAFPPGCMNFPGVLTIQGDDITDLGPLKNLQTVGADLIINNNEGLKSLEGLNNLTSVGGTLLIKKNAQLNSLAALSKLTQTGADLQIQNIGYLTNLTGLDNLTSVGGSIFIEDNNLLTSIAGLSALTQFKGTLEIIHNRSLSSLEGLNNLTSVGGLDIENNDRLSSLAALNKLTRTSAGLSIYYNSSLSSLEGLNNLTSVGGTLFIRSNILLTSIVGLSKITRIGGDLTIINNPVLSACAIPPICQYMTNPAGSINISGNAPGCQSQEDVQADCAPLAITTQPPSGSTVCTGATVTASVSITGNARAYQWYRNGQLVSGQTTSTLSLTNVQPAYTGSYVVMVSNSVSSLTSTAFNLTVNQPTVSINPSATAICSGQTARLTASGTATYQWRGPNGFTSTSSTVSVSVTGTYSLTGTSQGCSAIAAAIVTVNVTPTVSLTNNGPLTCARTVVALTASANAAGGTYRFTGPGANENTANPQIFVVTPGLYNLIYTSPQGCTATTTSNVEQDVAQPQLAVQNDGPLTCAKTSVTIRALPGQGAILPQGTTYQWSGPGGLSSVSSSFTTTQAGNYSLIITFPNSCSSLYTTLIESNTATVHASLVASGTLTCSTTSVTLTASPTDQVTYSFSGPGLNQSSAFNNATVSAAGTYSLVITSTNGCSAMASTTVEQNLQLASPSLHTASGQTNLTVPQYSGTVTLLIDGCSGSTSWRGPAGSTGTAATITVPTTQTGRFVYQATCQLGTCQSEPVSATITVQAEALKILVGSYDCASRQLSLRTTGGNGQPIEYQIPSVTTGWESSSTFTLQDKHIGKSLKLRARQRSSTNGGWDEAEISFTPQACGARLAADGVEVSLQVVVLGNPVLGQQVEFEVRGVQGQRLQLRVLNLKGEVLDEQHQPEAQSVERIRLRIGEGSGIYLLQALTPTQQRSVKLIKP